jgi:pimeloyl-ACP methyl ester carboxylesterase
MKRFVTVLGFMALSGAALADGVQVNHQGLKLNADFVKTEDWQSRTAIILHGSMAHKDMEIIQSMQDLLTDKGISSLAMTLSLGQSNREGMGACDVPHDHTQEDALKEIGAWVNYLKQQGVQKIDLVAHSRGGQQITQFALENPTLISKLAMIAPMTYTFAPSRENSLAQSLIGQGYPQALMSAKSFLHCQDVKATARSVASYAQDNPKLNTPTLLGQIKQPAFVVIGSEDQVVADLADQMTKVPQVKTATIDGADHFFLDLYIEDAMDAIANFLAD